MPVCFRPDAPEFFAALAAFRADPADVATAGLGFASMAAVRPEGRAFGWDLGWSVELSRSATGAAFSSDSERGRRGG
jgi:hypothetical protein